MCKDCGERVWANLDGSCASGHPDTSVSDLEVPHPEQLDADTLMREKQGGAPEPTVKNLVDFHSVYNGLIDAASRLRAHAGWC